MDKVRYGIIGLGNQGSFYTLKIFDEGIAKEAEITAFCDINPQKIETLKGKTQTKDARYFTDYVELLDSGLCDAILVETPHYKHPEIVMECLKRGIHVISDKPAGVYTKQVREMNEMAANTDAVFGMMFNQRTNCLYRKMKELIENGEIGEIQRVTWIITNWFRTQTYYDGGSWRATWSGEGGGVLMNQAPHQLDLLQWICGMPVKVHAKMQFGAWHDIEVEDDVSAWMEFPNGATGVFITSTGDVRGTNRLEIQMDKAKLTVENGKLWVEEYAMTDREFNAVNTQIYGKMDFTRREVETDGENPQHVGVLNAWGKAILGQGKLVAHGSEGINGLTLANAMYLSAFLGKEVQLPIDEDLYYAELQKRVAASKRKNTTSVFVNDRGNYDFGSTKN